MKPTITLPLAIVCAAATSFAITYSNRSESLQPTGADPEVAALRSELDKLRADLAEIRRAAPTAAATPTDGHGRVAVPTLTDEQVAAAIDRYLAANGGKLAANAALPGGGKLDVAATFKALLTSARYDENEDAYKAILAGGKMDELIAMFEQRAKDNPKDPAAQMDLANAYMAHLRMDNTKWQLSKKADGVYDQVLALDENHWEARFSKAVSYTFWPEFTGKRTEALTHFERLVEQQDKMPVQDHQAQTYLFLGNLLEAKDPARARETWQRGLRRHPNNQDLQRRLAQ